MRWENFSAAPLDPGSLDKPAPQARFAALEVPFTDAKTMNALQKDFLDYAYRTGQVSVHANEALKLYAGPQTSEGEFRMLCRRRPQGGDEEVRKLSEAYDKKIMALNVKWSAQARAFR